MSKSVVCVATTNDKSKCNCNTYLTIAASIYKVIEVRAAPILVSTLVLGQYQHILMVSESVKLIIQVPILLLVCFKLLNSFFS